MSMDRRYFMKAIAGTAAGLSASGLDAFGKTRSHKVVRGDTLSELAQKYDTSISSIKRLNNLKSDTIVLGKTLLIPSPSGSTNIYLGDVINKTSPMRISSSRWKHIVVHHSGIKYGNASAYHSNHLRRGMKNGLAYHFVIGNGIDSGNGKIEMGNRWLKQLNGGHVKNSSVNHTGIGICLVGNFQKERPSSRQLNSLYELITYLRTTKLKSRIKVSVHKEIDGYKHTVCPGRYFPVSDLHKRFPS